MKPWVQPSLCCVNLPSFSPDTISRLPPPNTPIYASICSAQLTSKMWLLMVASIVGNKCLCALFWWRPPQSFWQTSKETQNQKVLSERTQRQVGWGAGTTSKFGRKITQTEAGKRRAFKPYFGVCRFLHSALTEEPNERMTSVTPDWIHREAHANLSVIHSSDIKSQKSLQRNKSDYIYSQLMVEKMLLNDAACNTVFPRRRQGPGRVSIRFARRALALMLRWDRSPIRFPSYFCSWLD